MWVSFALTVIPYVLKIVNWFLNRAHDKDMLRMGRTEATKKQLEAMAHTLAIAKAAEATAKAAHAKNATDGAFDPDFFRGD